MSDDTKRPTSAMRVSPKDPVKSSLPNQKSQFESIHQDLKSALNVWDELSSKTPERSADERRLEEIKTLLKKLQKEMAELNF